VSRISVGVADTVQRLLGNADALADGLELEGEVCVLIPDAGGRRP
jgi:hypothetical protein